MWSLGERLKGRCSDKMFIRIKRHPFIFPPSLFGSDLPEIWDGVFTPRKAGWLLQGSDNNHKKEIEIKNA
jgi:hypothetical protein